MWPHSVDFIFSPSKVEMKEPNVCKLSFRVIKKPLNLCKASFCFSGPRLPLPAHSHKTFGNQRVIPQKQKQGQRVPET